ncbi:MAG: hypothetical protein Q9214_001725 [Letrouitia sp. 1 TL-2023]
MDGASAVASIGSIANGAFRVIEILNTIRQGGKQRLRLLTTIGSLWAVLQSVQSNLYTEDDELTKCIPDSFGTLQGDNGAFAQVDAIAKKLETRLGSHKGARKILQDVKWPFTKAEVETSISELEKLTSAINLALTASTLVTLRETQKLSSEIRLATMDAEFKAMLDWISPFDFVKQQHKLNNQTYKGTGEWFLQKPEFQLWVLRKTSTLWCPGIPGAGKTHLATIVYDHLRNIPDTSTLIVYCGYVDPPDQTRSNFLGALIRQIMQLRPELGDRLRKSYRTYSKQGKQLLVAELAAVFEDLISELKDCFIVVDALDDVREESQRYQLLNTVISNKTNIMVNSRPLDNIRHFFCFDSVCGECRKHSAFFLNTSASNKEVANICKTCIERNHAVPSVESQSMLRIFNARRLDIEASQNDLQNYVLWRINTSVPLSNCVKRHSELQQEIVDTVVKQAKGMFLLTKLHLDALAPKRTPKAVRKALQELPSGVNDTYDQALLRIKALREDNGEEDSRYAINLLMWTTFARRPLTVAEMEHAVTISFDMSNLPPNEDCLMRASDIDPDEVLSASELTSMCAGLVIIDASDKVLFVHFTTQDYFLTNSSALFPEAHLAMARACLTYLSMEPFQKGPCPEPYKVEIQKRTLQYPFLTYCSINIGWHGQRTVSQSLTKSVLTFLRIQALLDSTYQIFDPHDLLSSNPHERPRIYPLHLAAYWGFKDVVEVLLKTESVECTCSSDETPLVYAIRNRHAAVVEILLEAGANPNTLSRGGYSALFLATSLEDLPITKLLLRREDTELEQTSTYNTRWMLTKLHEHPEIEEILSSRRTDVNFQDDFNKTVLHHTAR